MKKLISPSILSVEKDKIPQAIKEMENNGARWIHFDVMDGKFVPSTTFTLEETRALLKQTRVTKDVHIMVANPKSVVKLYCDAGANYLTFHYEACKDVIEVSSVIDMIHSYGVKAGLSIKPNTDIEAVIPFLNKIDLVLVMSVEPGKGGQAFIPSALKKIKKLRKWIDKRNLNCLIEVDGGINGETGKLCREAGVDILVAGSYLYGHDDIKERFELLK